MSSPVAPHSAASRLTFRSIRRGFTLPEILIVVVMLSLLALVAIPRFANANGRRHLESARMRVAAALSTARQAAIQKGQTVRFVLKKNQVTVVASGTDTLLRPVPLDTLYKVSATVAGAAVDSFSVDFSARGFATNLTDKTSIGLARTGSSNDSVVVTKFGMVKR